MHKKNAILAFFPFLVKGALSLIILRAMRARGFDVTVGYYMSGAEGYSPDDCADFKQDNRILDLVGMVPTEAIQLISDTCRSRDIKLLLQIGAPYAYGHIPYIRERHPDLTIYDIQYNPVGHAVNHSLYEASFDAVIVESRAMEKFFLENTSLPHKLVHVVESGIDLSDFEPKSIADIDGTDFTLGYVGRMSPEKNPLGFIDLAEHLANKFPNMKFAMFGEGPQLGDVHKRVSESPVSNAIIVEGYIDHVRDAMHAVDCLIVPSKIDGRPNIIMEANACGVPVIGAPVGGIPELIREGFNGYVREPSDFEGITGILSGLVADRDMRLTVRENSRALAIQSFNRKRMLDDYERIFTVTGEQPTNSPNFSGAF